MSCSLDELVRRVRVRPLFACGAVFFVCLCARPKPADAQAFAEFGGGWNHLPPAPSSQGYAPGFSIQASIGWQLASRFLLRIDAVAVQFDDTVQVRWPGPPLCVFTTVSNPPPCGYSNVIQTVDVVGATANAILNVDPRGFFYLIGGTGFYSTNDAGPPRISIGVSAGAGITVPIASHLRIFAEARDHILLTNDNRPPWLVPITIGLRY